MEGYIFGVIVAFLAVSLTGTLISSLEPERKNYALKFQILCLFSLLMFVLSRFLWIRVTNAFNQKSWHRGLVKFLLLLFLGLGNSSLILGRYFVGPEPYFITLTAYVCLGFMLLTFVNILVWNIMLSILSQLKLRWKKEQCQKKMKFCVVAVSLLASFLMCISGWYTAMGKCKMVEISIPISKLPISLNGTKIVQLSDIHLGPTVGKSMLEDIVAMVMIKSKPDILVITGDLIDSSEKSLIEAAAPLARLKAKYGSFFVTGNHEYIAGNVDMWFSELQKLGITPLHNKQVKISDPSNPEECFYLAGVDDIQANSFRYPGHGMRLQRALHNRQAKYPTILLAHQPQAES